MVTQAEKARIFKALHERQGCFVIPNPWDAGSAKLLAGLGFEALATTSAGLAFALGKPDGVGKITRDETITNAHAIVAATDLPVSADLEIAAVTDRVCKLPGGGPALLFEKPTGYDIPVASNV